MKKINLGMFLASAAMVSACFSCSTPSQESKESNPITYSTAYKEGLQIVDQNCISCHSPKADMDSRIAPPLIAVKNHYLRAGMSEEEFVQSISSFLASPKIESSKMPRAIDKFGIMPNLGMSTEQYKAVATYIYQAEMEKSDWFEVHYQKEKEALMKYSEEGSEDYLKKGMNLALATKSVLGKNLLTAIKTKGTDQALVFCNERAMVLTDSMSANLQAKIKRVSDQNRNPDNLANDAELEYIQSAKKEIETTGQASPQMQEIDGQMVGYYPIMTNNMCLQCHGNPDTDINSKTKVALAAFYPDDKATGYTVDQLRGIWVVEMKK